VIHRPAPRFPTIFAMVLLALVVVPALVLAPAGATLWPGLVLWVLFEAFLATLLFQHVEAHVEGDQLTFVHRRWPLGGRRQTLPVADVERAELEPSPGRRGPAYRLALKLRDGKTVPLTDAYFGRTDRQERDLAELQRLLSR
jgi:hypothetical protein